MTDITGIALILLVVTALVVTVSLYVPVRWRLAFTVCSAVFQFHSPVEVLGIYPPATLLVALTLWPELFRNVRVVRFLPAATVAALIALSVISLAWSEDVRLGARTIIYTLPWLFVFAAAYRLGQQRERFLPAILAMFCVCALVEAALVVVFRVLPDVEEAYYKSTVAGFFISPNTLDGLFTYARNNVLDPAKAGGFFVSANPAAAFLGVSALIAISVALATRRRWLWIVAALLWVAIYFTGSKAGAILGLVVPALGAFAFLLFEVRQHLLVRLMLASAAAATSVFAVAVGAGVTNVARTGFFSASVDTLNMRRAIWGFAQQEFPRHPFRGQGFGGWENRFPDYASGQGLATGFPPHNTFIYLWSQTTLFSVALAAFFMATVLRFCWHAFRSPSREVRWLAWGTGLAYAWIFVQGLGENFGLLGDLHMQPPLAALLGLTFARYVAAREDDVA